MQCSEISRLDIWTCKQVSVQFLGMDLLTAQTEPLAVSVASTIVAKSKPNSMSITNLERLIKIQSCHRDSCSQVEIHAGR
jgi:hypothetical protein